MRDYFDVQREREQPTGPVTITVAGVNLGAARATATQVRTVLQASGQVVRFYPDSREMPDEVPACDVAIVIQHPQEEG